jgi:acetyl esterase
MGRPEPHPQVQVLLGKLAALSDRPISEMTPSEARAAAASELEFSGEPEPVAAIENRKIVADSHEIPIRIYRPRGPALLPPIAFFHSGGFVVGSIEQATSECTQLASRTGASVVSVEYRLAPENPYPAALDDAFAAALWVADNAEALGGPSGTVVVAGSSAGGNLAAAVALRAARRGRPAILAQLLIYPMLSPAGATDSYRRFAEGYGPSAADMRWFWECYGGGRDLATLEELSPLLAHDLSGLPPALLVLAELDLLVDEGEAYASSLAEAGVHVDVMRYRGMMHGFLEYPGELDGAVDAFRDIGCRLRSLLRSTSR